MQHFRASINQLTLQLALAENAFITAVIMLYIQ